MIDKPVRVALVLDDQIPRCRKEPMPLTVQVAERAAERSLGRSLGAVLIEPLTKLVEDWARLRLPASAALVSGVASELGLSLDGEKWAR
jgi:hypothetical protein